jgi:hypothetical protein
MRVIINTELKKKLMFKIFFIKLNFLYIYFIKYHKI